MGNRLPSWSSTTAVSATNSSSNPIPRIVLQGSPDSGAGMLLRQLYEKKDLSDVQTRSVIGMDFARWKPDADQQGLQIWRNSGGRDFNRARSELALQRLHKRASGFILIIDATSNNGWLSGGSVKEELTQILKSEDGIGLPLLLLANKQDSKYAMNLEELSERLELSKITGREWHLQGCSAMKGEGVQEGLQWLAARVKPRVGAALTPNTNATPSAVSRDSAI